MMPEKVDQMLKDYKPFKGRCIYLKAMIAEMEEDAEVWRRNLASDLVGATGKGEDGMPKGNTVSSPTERIGIMLASGYEPEDLKELEKKIVECRKELLQKSRVVQFVDAWLEGLTEKEQWVIRQQVIDGAFWREIIREYQAKYGDQYSKEGLKKIKRNALRKIYKLAS